MLTIYTATHCPVYPRTCQLVAQWRQQCPQLPLHVVNLDEPDVEWPSFVIGTPTYVWQGQVIFLGNPSFTELLQQVERLITQ